MNRPLLTAGLNASLSLSQQFRLGGDLSAWRYRDTGTSLRASLTGVVRLNSRASLTMSSGASSTSLGGPEYSALMTLSMVLGSHTTGLLSGQQHTGGAVASLDVSQGVPLEGGFGYRLRGEAAARPQGNAELNYQGPTGVYSAGVELAPGLSEARASMAGSLVAVDGKLILSRPIEQGFALVRAPGLARARVFLNNHAVAQTDSEGDALIPNLTPYYGNRLSISDQDIPEDFGVPDLDKLVAPHSRRGTTVRFETRRIRPIRGTLALADTDSAVLAFGDLSVSLAQEVQHSPIGRQGEFELEGLPPGSYEARVTYSGGVCVAKLEVPDTQDKLIDLAVVPCSPRPSQEP
jgi:outer membrane usher protein